MSKKEQSDVFEFHCKAVGLCPEKEYRFHPVRRWRFDYAFPEQMVAVEIEGGVWTQGRHTRGSGFVKDMEKYNAAAELGWLVFRYSPQMVESGEAVAQIEKVINERSTDE